MKSFKIGVLFLVAAFSIAAAASAALSNLSFDRSVSAGRVMVDTDENVAVQITNMSNYSGLVKTDADGKASINLNEAISTSFGKGFNTSAEFHIGTSANGVIKIKNNSDIPVTVSMTDESGSEGAISINPVAGSGFTIEVGQAGEYYFTVNTFGKGASSDELKAVLHIEGN